MNKKIKMATGGLALVLGAVTALTGFKDFVNENSKLENQIRMYVADDDIQRLDYLIGEIPKLSSGPSRYDVVNKRNNNLYTEFDRLLVSGALNRKEAFIAKKDEHMRLMNKSYLKALLTSFLVAGVVGTYAANKMYKGENR